LDFAITAPNALGCGVSSSWYVMSAPLPPAAATPLVIRDWPLVVVTSVGIVALWVAVFATAGSTGGTWGDNLIAIVLSAAIVAVAAVPHVRVDDREIRIRKLIRTWTVPLTDLIGIDTARTAFSAQRVPRLVQMDGTGVVFPARGFSLSGVPGPYQRAIAQIQSRAAALGNDVAIDL
jgi:hypothetical protein